MGSVHVRLILGVERTGAGSLTHLQYTPSVPSDALDAVRACLSREIGTLDFTSSLYAIVAKGATLPQVSLQETLHHCTRQIQQFGLEDIYKLVQSAERSRLGTLYDNIETTRLLVENALSTRIQICTPDPYDIWNYAHRTSNITRKHDLEDLPESLTCTLTDFALDALDLGSFDLQGYRLKALKNSRDSFWLSLGESDDERDKKFNSLLEQKSHWSSQTGICISEALEDIRYYRLHQGKLIPAKKSKTAQIGFGREDKARMSKQDWRKMALHMRDV